MPKRPTIQEILDLDDDEPLLFHIREGWGYTLGKFEVVYERAGRDGAVLYRCQGTGKDSAGYGPVRVQFDLLTLPSGQWEVKNLTIKRR